MWTSSQPWSNLCRRFCLSNWRFSSQMFSRLSILACNAGETARATAGTSPVPGKIAQPFSRALSYQIGLNFSPQESPQLAAGCSSAEGQRQPLHPNLLPRMQPWPAVERSRPRLLPPAPRRILRPVVRLFGQLASHSIDLLVDRSRGAVQFAIRHEVLQAAPSSPLTNTKMNSHIRLW